MLLLFIGVFVGCGEFGEFVLDGVLFLLFMEKLLCDDVELKKLCVEWYFFIEFFFSFFLRKFFELCFFEEVELVFLLGLL